MRAGIDAMYVRGEDVLRSYYVTLYNENYVMPPQLRPFWTRRSFGGLYRFREAPEITGAHAGSGTAGAAGAAPRARLIGSGSILQQGDRRPGAPRGRSS